jgi:5,10-methylenetetrahydromethanopterin reductase
LSKEAVADSTRLVRKGARDAGRDPSRVRVWTILLTACETSEEVMLQTVIRRINTYLLFPKLFDLICDANGWDKSVAADLRRRVQAMNSSSTGGSNGDENASTDLVDLRQLRDLYPERWIRDGCAVGNAEECIQATLNRFEAGADGVLFHGTSPENLSPLLKLWPEHRSATRFVGRSVNPGL